MCTILSPRQKITRPSAALAPPFARDCKTPAALRIAGPLRQGYEHSATHSQATGTSCRSTSCTFSAGAHTTSCTPSSGEYTTAGAPSSSARASRAPRVFLRLRGGASSYPSWPSFSPTTPPHPWSAQPRRAPVSSREARESLRPPGVTKAHPRVDSGDGCTRSPEGRGTACRFSTPCTC